MFKNFFKENPYYKIISILLILLILVYNIYSMIEISSLKDDNSDEIKTKYSKKFHLLAFNTTVLWFIQTI